MIKRYGILPYIDNVDGSLCIQELEAETGKYCIHADIKDSIIVWHDLRKNPDDLPPLQCYVFISGRKNRHVAALLPEGWHFLGNVPTFKIIEWAYIPPKE